MRSKTAKLSIAIAVLALAQATLFAQTTLESPLATVTLIKKDIVSFTTFKNEVAVYEKMLGRKLTLDEKKTKLKQNIEILLLMQACERDGVSVSEADVNKTIQALTAQQNGGVPLTDAQLEEYVKMQGMTVAQFKDTVKKQLLIDRYIMSKKQKEIEALKYLADPLESEILAFYTAQKDKFVRPESAVISVIMIGYKDKTDAQKASARDTLKGMSLKIGGDANTFAIYLTEGKKPGSAFTVSEGYQLPFGDKLRTAMFGEAFMNAVAKMSIGGISFIESEKGVFIVRMSDRMASKQLTLADPVATGVTLRDYIIQLLKKNRLDQEYFRIQSAVVEELRSQATIVANESLLNY